MKTTTNVEVSLPATHRRLYGDLVVPADAIGVVAFAHGSGSSRHSPRNQFVASELQHAGVATLLLDLLEEAEEGDREKVFDIDLLAERLQAAALWLRENDSTATLPLGYFGASTGAAAALEAAAREPQYVSAVVSRGGRPDMAMRWLPLVKAPTLLIVGGHDEPVLQWNRDAYRHIEATKELIVIPGATHLFEEPGTLQAVARHAHDWFVKHLGSAA